MLDHAVNGEKSYEHGNLRQVNVSVLAENCPEPKKCSHCGKKGHLAKDPGKKPMAKPKAKSQPTKPSGRGKGRGKGGRKTKGKGKGNKFRGGQTNGQEVEAMDTTKCF